MYLIILLLATSLALPPPLPIPDPNLPSGKPLPTCLNKVHVLIIGGTKGIGNATAWEFYNRGAKVTITTRRLSTAKHSPFTVMELEYGKGNNNIERFVRKYIRRFGRIPDVLIDCGLVSYNGNLLDFTREDMEYGMRMFAIDPILLVREFLLHNDVRRPFNVSFALSTASYGSGTHFIALYAAGKQMKKDWVRDFALYEGPKYYPNVRLVGVACSNVNTTLALTAYNPSVLKGDVFQIAYQQLVETGAITQGISPVIVGLAHLEATTTLTYVNSTLFLVPTSPGGRIFSEILHAIYVVDNTTQFEIDSLEAYRLFGINITAYL